MKDITSNLRFRIHTTHNESFVAYLESSRQEDDIGALYYVVAVVLIYALSIVMMIASLIRKNQQDNQLRTYLKEMAVLRKNDRREKIIGKLSKNTVVVSKSSGVDMPVTHAVQIVTAKEVDKKCINTFFGKNNGSDHTKNDCLPQLPTEYHIDLSKSDSQSPKQDRKPCAEINVINENFAL